MSKEYSTDFSRYGKTIYCPFCGSMKIKYHNGWKEWECKECEKRFEVVIIE